MIKSGDILIFEADNSWLSKVIAKLTKSNVSHSAMIHHGMYAVEMGGKGISVNYFEEDEKGEQVYVLRMDPEKNPDPLIHASDLYVKAKVKYDYVALALLAGLLIYREIRPTTVLNEIMFKVLKLGCLELNHRINQRIYGEEQKVMMCSQLVYQCYLDCGKEYYIEIEDGLLQNRPGSIRLIDLIEKSMVKEVKMLDQYVKLEEEDIEALARELYQAFDEAEHTEEGLLLGENDLMKAAYLGERFLELYRVLTPENLLQSVPIKALFVTPADLFLKSKNLEKVGKMKVTRQSGQPNS